MYNAPNPTCDGDRCFRSTGEVRRLPTGYGTGHGAVILCQHCFEHEMAWRREKNKKLEPALAFPIPSWESLEVYHAS